MRDGGAVCHFALAGVMWSKSRLARSRYSICNCLAVVRVELIKRSVPVAAGGGGGGAEARAGEGYSSVACVPAEAILGAALLLYLCAFIKAGKERKVGYRRAEVALIGERIPMSWLREKWR